MTITTVRRAAPMLFGGAALALAAVAGYWVFAPVEEAASPARSGGRAPAAVAVEVSPVTTGPIHEIRTLTGSLDPGARFEVAAKAGGLLKVLAVGIGDTVMRGGVVARLDDAEFLLEVEQAQAELKVAQASLQEARGTLTATRRAAERVSQLHRQKVASQAELDAAEADAAAQAARVQLTEAQVAQREAQLKAAEIRLSYATVRATWQGGEETRVVGERFIDEGTMISANAPLVSVLDIRTLMAIVHVTERDLGRLAIGQEAEIVADPYPDRAFTGRVARIAPLLRETSRQARVEIALANDEGLLRPGMFVRARVQLAMEPAATIVPWAAIVQRDGRQGVFSVDRAAAAARFVAVRVGIVEGERVQIVDPPLAGEVVTLGQHLLNDGSRLILPEAPVSAPAPIRLGQDRAP